MTWKASDGPRIPDWKNYDVRYASMSSVALLSGGPTIDGVRACKMEGQDATTMMIKRLLLLLMLM
jgi:hypothetical protein